MSYDLYLYRVPLGADPAEACRAAFEAADDPPTPPDAPQQMTRIAAALRAESPALEGRQGGVGGHAFVLLQSPDRGIQLWLFPGCVSMDVAFWHSGAAAAEVWREAWRYLRVLQRETGGCIYDPQQDRVLDLHTDFDAVLAAYAGGVRQMEEIQANPPGGGESD